MADATYTFSSTGADKIERDARRVEGAMQKTKGAGTKGGMAVLELSRGLEDFAMAGMKGAINNIPGLLMHLGVGMGLTGVATMATVAIWKGVDALEAYMDKMHEASMVNAAKGLKMFNIEEFEIGFRQEAIDRAKEIEPMLRGIAEAQEYLNQVRSNERTSNAVKLEIDAANEMLWLTITGASAEEKRLAVMNQSVRAEEAKAEAASQTLKDTQLMLDGLKEQKKIQEEIVAQKPTGDVDEMRRKTMAFQVSEFKRFKEMETTVTTGGGGMPFQQVRVKIPVDEAMDRARDSAQKYHDELKRNEEERIKSQSAAALVAEQEIILIQEKIDAAQSLLNKNKLDADAAKEMLELQKKLLKVKKQQDDFDANASEAEKLQKEREKAMKSMASQRGVDVSGMLSSQARAGLSGNETKAAMDVLNIAKQQLSTLKQIARNTLRRTTVYA